MSVVLRIILILGSVAFAGYVLGKIRHSKMRIEDSIFWILFSLIIFCFGLFPGLPTLCAELIGIQSPVNFVYLFILLLIIVKCLGLSLKLSKTEATLFRLVQKEAIDEAVKEQEKMGEEHKEDDI